MNIAVLGLGIIGSVWARHWHADGHAVRAWNRTPKPAQPGWQPDPVAAVRGADLVVLVMADHVATAAMLAQVAGELRPGMVVAQHATIGVDETRSLATAVRTTGADYLDMPFTGSKPAAEARQNVFFVGDDVEALARVRPAYERVAKALLPMGGVGRAAAMKLCMNLLIAGTYQALAEGHRLATAAGLEPDLFFRTLDLNVARSGLVDLKKDKLVKRDWSPQFSVKHMHKDLRLALRLAHELGVGLPLTAGVEGSYCDAEAAGHSDHDFSALAESLD